MMINLQKKYKVSEKELKAGIDLISSGLGKICNINVVLAITELLSNGDIRPSNIDIEQLIKEALKDYRGNDMVIVTTTRGGAVDIEDFDANALVSENEELEEELE